MTVNALQILCPWQTCSINDLSTALGSIQPYIEYILYYSILSLANILPVEMCVTIYTVYELRRVIAHRGFSSIRYTQHQVVRENTRSIEIQ